MLQTAINLRWTALDVVLDTNTQMHTKRKVCIESNLDKFCFHSWTLLVKLGRKCTQSIYPFIALEADR